MPGSSGCAAQRTGAVAVPHRAARKHRRAGGHPRWFAADPPVPLRPLVREALGQVAAAFPDAARAVQPG
jgi:hypothetical protein